MRRIDHRALLCREVAANRAVAESPLGLAPNEQVVFEDGAREIGSWLSPSPLPHQLANVLDLKAAAGGCITAHCGWTNRPMCCAPPASCGERRVLPDASAEPVPVIDPR